MISDLYDMRYILEPEITALAAQHATAEQVERMRELVKQIEQSFDQGNQQHVRFAKGEPIHYPVNHLK